ncbi:MAG: RNA ligase family protein [Saprospiraceae bacterium]
MTTSRKYCRSLHAQISLGTTSDDRFMPNGYMDAFSKMDNLILTEKLDGQNNCFNKQGVFARSHTAPSNHPWDKPLRDRWKLIKDDLGELEIFGENMYGIHSIAYTELESYFYVFAVRDGDTWLSWEEVQFYANMLDFPTVPAYDIKISLGDFYKKKNPRKTNENEVLAEWLKANLGMSWLESVETAGLLGGYDPLTNQPCSEGFVIRNSDAFQTNEGIIDVAPNEFNNLFKLVRAAHVKTDVHWTKTWKPAALKDYSKYKWYGYEYLSNKK